MFSVSTFLKTVRRLMHGARRRRSRLSGEVLEHRTLLSGNVSVSLVNGDLFVNGDSSDNAVQISVEAGNVVVAGTGGTTINGSSDPFTLVTGGTTFAGSVFSALSDGDDTLVVGTGVTISGAFVLNDVNGITKVGINSATIGGLNLVTGNDADEVSLDGATINGNVIFYGNDGNNLLSVNDSTIEGNLFFQGGKGEDDVVVLGSTINGNTLFDTGKWMDSFALQNSTFNGNLFVQAGQHNDTMLIDTITVTGRTDLYMWLGSDAIKIQGTNDFQGDFFAGGLLGNPDAFENTGTNTFGGTQTQPGFESSTVASTLLNTQITNGALFRAAQSRDDLGGTPLTDLTITTDTSTNTLQTLSGETFTQQDTFTVTGTTAAFASIAADLGAGTFTTATATADASGNYTINVPLANSTNTVTIRSTDVFNRTATGSFNIESIQGSIVEFTSNMGTFQVELFDDAAPLAVANFQNYLDRYANLIVHRSYDGQFVHAGAITLEGDNIAPVSKDASIQNEFSTNHRNLRGTLAMALSNDPNSGTSEWFFNTGNNSQLDTNQHTVFGRVIGTGMDVVDAINGLPTQDLETFLSSIAGVALEHVPLIGYEPLNQQITGTASVTNGDVNLVGTGTAFTTELNVGDAIRIGTFSSTVASITDDNNLVLGSVATSTQTDADLFIESALNPTAANYVVFSSIAQILV